MSLVKIAELTPEQETERDSYMADCFIAQSKQRGDFFWRQAEQITGLGDYTPADEGEAPKGAEWN